MPLLTVGHRGLMGVEPENTLRSFRRAVREEVDVVELDLHRSKDGQLVVMHDAAVDRTTDGTGLIGDLTVDELRTLDAGEGEVVPVFEEVVEVVPGPLQAEIKDRAAARLLAQAIEDHGLHDRVRVISFQDEALRETRALLPDIPLALVTAETTATAPERAEKLGASMVSCEYAELTEDLVARCRARGVAVISWTVNTPEQLARVRDLGLDGVVTDVPELARAARTGA